MMAGRRRGETAAAVPSAGGQLASTSLLSLAGDVLPGHVWRLAGVTAVQTGKG